MMVPIFLEVNDLDGWRLIHGPRCPGQFIERKQFPFSLSRGNQIPGFGVELVHSLASGSLVIGS